MGNAAYRQTTLANNPVNQQEAITNFMQIDLPKFVKQNILGNGKFLKSYIMRVDSTQMVVKIYMKLPDEDLQISTMQLTSLLKTIPPSKYPNLLPYQMWMKSASMRKSPASPVYLLRQYFHFNLGDRLSTRPFLNQLERLWILFQLFKCLEICHELGIVHGDIKPENVLCTTSNWVVLTDFSPFKPVLLPDDDPTDFQYYFDTMSKNRCYIAPERFYKKDVGNNSNSPNPPALSPNTPPPTPTPQATPLLNRFRSNRNAQPTVVSAAPPKPSLTHAMDVFSLGVLCAEVVLDKAPLLDLPAMLQYLSSSADSLAPKFVENIAEESQARQLLMRIGDLHLRNVIIDMTKKDPEKRLSVSEYLSILQGKQPKKDIGESNEGDSNSSHPSSDAIDPSLAVFPNYFESCLYPLFFKLHWQGVTPDDRITIICEAYEQIVKDIAKERDELGEYFFNLYLKSTARLLHSAQSVETLRGVHTSLLLLPSLTLTLKAEQREEQGDMRKKVGGLEVREDVLRSARLSPSSHSFSPPPASSLSQSSSADLLERAQRQMEELEKLAAGIDMGDASKGNSRDKAVKKAPSSNNSNGKESKCMGQIDALLQTHGKSFFSPSTSPSSPLSHCEGMVVIIDLLSSNYRHLKFLPSRALCLLLLLRLGLYCNDQVIMQRIVPSLLLALEDSNPSLKALSLRSLSTLLSRVSLQDISMVNFFPNYLFPYFNKLLKDTDIMLRSVFAECLGVLSLTAKRFVESAQIAYLRSAESTLDFPYESKVEWLKEQVSRWIRDLIIDGYSSSNLSNNLTMKSRSQVIAESSVKKAILQSMQLLCSFFGQESAMEKILTQALTFLNDQDWELRAQFCQQVPAVCSFLGSTITSEYILPCMEQSLVDIEDRVVHCFLSCLAQLFTLQLVSKSLVIDYVRKLKALLLHPNLALSTAAIKVISSTTLCLTPVDLAVYVLPEIQPYLKYRIVPQQISVEVLKHAVKQSISPLLFRKTLLKKLDNYAFETGSNVKVYEVLGEKVIDKAGNSIRISSMRMSSPSMSSKKTMIEEANITVSPAEEEKLELLDRFLDGLCKEIFNKAVKWKLFSSSNYLLLVKQNTTRNLVLCPPTLTILNSTSNNISGLNVAKYYLYDNLLDYSQFSLSDNSVNSLSIPLMKHISYISEDIRHNNIYLVNSETKNKQNVKALYIGNNYSYDIFRGTKATGEILSDNVYQDSLANSNLLSTSLEVHGQSIGKGKQRNYSYANMDSIGVLRRIRALRIPPLPVDMGNLTYGSDEGRGAGGEDGSGGDINTNRGGNGNTTPTPWRPSQGVLFMTLREHSAAVNRLVVSPDQQYFASASSDHTVRVWQTRSLDRSAFPRSTCVYGGHRDAVLDAVCVENTHSVASASKDGSVHVWRVDLQSSKPTDQFGDITGSSQSMLRVQGSTMIRSVENGEEGGVLNVQHYNTDVCSVLVYATQKGGVHGWDLRCPEPIFKLALRPELGYGTSMTVAPDRQWIALGSSKGYLAIWDVRYNSLSSLYQHSSAAPLHRLACCKPLRNGNNGNIAGLGNTEGAYIFVATNNNETAVFGLPEGGDCFKCFRTLMLDDSKQTLAPLPVLSPINIPTHPFRPISSAYTQSSSYSPQAVRAMIGRISQSQSSYLITAGTDRHIRYWDFRAPENCYCIAGLEATQSKSLFVTPKLNNELGKLFVCYTSQLPSDDKILQSQVPVKEQRGLVAPSVNFKDTILDLKDIELPMRLMLSSSRDGEIKLWR